MKYKVKLWPGKGYWLDEAVEVEANKDDLETVLILASIKDKNCLFIEASNAAPELEGADNYTYLDRTEYGASCGYLCTENTMIADDEGKVVYNN